MFPRIIGLTGRTGNGGIASCGKDSVADVLELKYGYCPGSFAGPLYDMVLAGLGISGLSEYWQNRENKKAPIDWLSTPDRPVSLRTILETLGTEWGRNMIQDDIWLRIADRRYGSSQIPVVFKDLRFENECEWIESKGGLVVHIMRTNYFSHDATVVHSSNQPLQIKPSHVIIDNTGTLEDLENNVTKLMESLQ